MRPHVAIAALLLAAGCGATDPHGAGEPPAPPVPSDVIGCDEPVGGVPWTDAVVESAPGYDAELAALDLGALPETLDTSTLPVFQKAVLAWALAMPADSLVADSLVAGLDRDALLEAGEMGRAVAGAFARTPGALDFDFLRRGLHRYDACTRRLPETLDGFRAAVLDFRALEPRIVDSMPKAGPRRLWEDGIAGVFVAETLDGDGGVRETEIVRRDAAGELSFAVYGVDGLLTDRSRFATTGGGSIVAAAPYACLTCHVDSASWTFTVVYPSL